MVIEIPWLSGYVTMPGESKFDQETPVPNFFDPYLVAQTLVFLDMGDPTTNPNVSPVEIRNFMDDFEVSS